MKQRILTAVVALLFFLPILIYGGLPFKAMIYLIATVGLYELLRMKRISMFSFPGILTTLLLWGLLYPTTSLNMIEGWSFSKSEVILLFVLMLLGYTVLVKNKFTFDEVGFLLLSTVYLGMGFYYFIETRLAGLEYIIFALLVVWATDSGAYFFGRAFGKRKLWPKISPKKTIEGAIGGILLAIVFAVIYQMIQPINDSLFVVVTVTILISVFGQIGDLVESAFKRHYSVKDSGNILPGHGGILDRFDSLIFIFPILHFVHFIS